MRLIKSLGAAALLALCADIAGAVVTAEEAKQLGSTLTAWGAEVTGNKDGTIPAYAGGLTTAPLDYKPGSGIYPDPFRNEKPLFSITSKNMAQYADKLSEGQKLLLSRYPDYRMDVYPTHRTVAYPQAVIDATLKNATRAATTQGGVGISGSEGGLPFPIPKTGHEVMWNHMLTYVGDVMEFRQYDFYADQQGRTVLTGDSFQRNEMPYYQPDNPERTKTYFKFYADVVAPTSLVGNQYMFFDPLDAAKDDRRAFQYIPGQRRVKQAPELAYDTPNPSGAGMVLLDDMYLFNGKMDRFAFKLIGKKEMYIPYNNYRFVEAQQVGDTAKAIAAIAGPKFLKPELERWELHRVWVVEATLLDGKRHVYKKRVFYFDEDVPGAGVSDQYDGAGKLLRSGAVHPIQLYDKNVAFTYGYVYYDFSANVYLLQGYPLTPLLVGTKGPGSAKAWRAADWVPESMAGRGIR